MELLEPMEDEKKKEGPSLVVFLAVCVVATLIAGGAGFGVSATMLKPATAMPVADSAAMKTKAGGDGHAPADGHGSSSESAGEEHAAKLVVVDIPSITTNLLDPSDAWIRMELSLVFEEEADELLAEEIHQDILSYVHTMKLYNLRGGSGYQHLMEDLADRAAIRSDGRVKRVLVRSFILE